MVALKWNSEMTETMAENAREILKAIFPFTEKYTDYISAYKTVGGRDIALERNRTDACYLWLEKYDQSIDGVEIKNLKNPGMPYDPKQSRNSNLNDTNAPRLKVGNRVWYLKIENLDALRLVAEWYGAKKP